MKTSAKNLMRERKLEKTDVQNNFSITQNKQSQCLKTTRRQTLLTKQCFKNGQKVIVGLN